MRINDDFSKRVVIRHDDYEWVESPMPGVERMMFDRVGEEVARATSLVRYAPNSTFSEHEHSGGEEFLVLEGEFADEHRAYPVGSYVRNPIGTAHSPSIGAQGCIIFVKLQQFESDDQSQFVVDTKNQEWSPGLVPGLEVMSLHQYEREQVALVKWAPHTEFNEHTHWGGEEIFVIAGTFFDEHGEYPAGTWIRSPDQSSHRPFTRDEGALIYVKVGHLL
jgi:anti-sigma factor ChrR (cupin superfamily)